MDIYSHFTCATGNIKEVFLSILTQIKQFVKSIFKYYLYLDTQNIKVVFSAVKDTIIQKYMKEASIM